MSTDDDAPPLPQLKRVSSPTLMPMDSPFDELEEDDHTELAAAKPGAQGTPAPEQPSPAQAAPEQPSPAQAAPEQPSPPPLAPLMPSAPLALGNLPPVPEEAQRRGAVDTLYSAEWFGEDGTSESPSAPASPDGPKAEPAPAKKALAAAPSMPAPAVSQPTSPLLIIGGAIGVMILIALTCGGGITIGLLLALS